MTSSKFLVATLAVAYGLSMASCGPQNPPVVTRDKGKQPDSVLVYKYFYNTGQKELYSKNFYTYDAAGNTIIAVEGDSKHERTYDAVGNKTSETVFDNYGNAGEWYELYQLTYLYNDQNRVTRTTRLEPAGDNGVRDTSAVAYTEWKDYFQSRSKQYSYYRKNDGTFGTLLSFVWDTYYTDFGKLEKQVVYDVHPDSTLTESYRTDYTYDEHHNLIRYSQYMYQYNKLSINQIYEYAYDKDGAILSAIRKDIDSDGNPKYDFEWHLVYYY